MKEKKQMKFGRILNSSLWVLLLAPITLPQAPTNEVDVHIATAKAAAREDYRGTFINLCLPGTGAVGRGTAQPADAGGRGTAQPVGARRGGGTSTTPDR